MGTRRAAGMLATMTSALLIAAAPAAPAEAATGAADLAVEAAPGQIYGNTLTIEMIFHNYGPGTVPTGEDTYEITAPGGTVFAYTLERTLPNPRCTVLVAHHRVRCHSGSMSYPDNHQPSGVTGGLRATLDFTIVGDCISSGRYKVEYSGDPKRSNNSVTLHVAASTGRACRPGPTKTSDRPTARPAVTPTPAAPSRTPTRTATTTAPSSPLAVTRVETPTPDIVAVERRSLATPVAVGGAMIGILAVVALGAGLLLRRRRTVPPTPPE